MATAAARTVRGGGAPDALGVDTLKGRGGDHVRR
jgi:hypothetical protein